MCVEKQLTIRNHDRRINFICFARYSVIFNSSMGEVGAIKSGRPLFGAICAFNMWLIMYWACQMCSSFLDPVNCCRRLHTQKKSGVRIGEPCVYKTQTQSTCGRLSTARINNRAKKDIPIYVQTARSYRYDYRVCVCVLLCQIVCECVIAEK